MSEPPEFPQEKNPAIQYIVRQVSKIEDAQACATGYYQSLSKVLKRLDRTDYEINQLRAISTELKTMVDIEIISSSIDYNLKMMSTSIDTRLALIQENNYKKFISSLDVMTQREKNLLAEIQKTNEQTRDRANRILAELETASGQIRTLISPPWWKIWGIRAVFFIAGALAIKYGVIKL